MQPAYEKDFFTARLNAIAETGLEENAFPENSSWTLEKILDL